MPKPEGSGKCGGMRPKRKSGRNLAIYVYITTFIFTIEVQG